MSMVKEPTDIEQLLASGNRGAADIADPPMTRRTDFADPPIFPAIRAPQRPRAVDCQFQSRPCRRSLRVCEDNA